MVCIPNKAEKPYYHGEIINFLKQLKLHTTAAIINTRKYTKIKTRNCI